MNCTPKEQKCPIPWSTHTAPAAENTNTELAKNLVR